MQLGSLSEEQTALIRHLSLLPDTGVFKQYFKTWLHLDNLNQTNKLIHYGYAGEDTNNRKVYLHPMIAEIVRNETTPSTSNCKVMLDALHQICLVHGLEVGRPATILACLQSINRHIVWDMPEYDLRFLQNIFPYFMKYGEYDYSMELIQRIEQKMTDSGICDSADKALILDYKAALFMIQKQYDNAIKKRNKAITILEKEHTRDAPLRTALLLSNLHSNLAQTYLLLNKPKECEQELRTALDIRMEYNHYEEMRNHDLLQQLLIYITLLIDKKEFDHATSVLSRYETIVTEAEGTSTVDYGMIQFCHGLIHLGQLKPALAEDALLKAKVIFENLLGTENAYTKSCYRYLHNLYSRWKGHEKLAGEYKRLLSVYRKDLSAHD